MMAGWLLVVACAALSAAAAGRHPRGTDGQQSHQYETLSDTRLSADDGETTADGPVTESSGGVFRGSWMETRRGRVFEAYRGIRYAAPPIGELRFQPPQQIHQYAGEVDASEEGPACPKLVRGPYYYDEDCLRINVYTPKNHNINRLLPVIVFIHPGGFYSMSGRSDLVGPHYFLDRDVVLVAINYRLGTLGLMSTGDELAPGNNAFKDQVVALRWINKNIAAFGGDPELVTITGCSAGSHSVMLHMISPMSKGLFHRAISMSGAPTSKAPLDRHQRHLAVKQAELVGCPSNTTREIIDCLKTKPWQDITSTIDSFFEFGYDPVRIWHPIVELDFGQERFLPIDPMEAIREGKMHAVPYIIAQTRDEFFWKAFTILNNETLLTNMSENWENVAPISFLLPRDNASFPTRRLRQAYLQSRQLRNDSCTADRLGKLYADAITAFPVHRLANLMCRHSPQPVWYYEFSYIGNHSYYEDPVTKKPTGVSHHDDLIYLFSLRYRFPDILADSSTDSLLVDRMTGIFYTFAKNGDPNRHSDLPELAGLSWPAMTPQQRRYLRIGEDFQIHTNLKEERLMVWDELYPIQY